MITILDIDPSNAFDAQSEKAKGTAGVIIKGGQGMLAYNFQPLVDQCSAAGLPYGIYWLVDARYHSTDHFAEIQKAFPNGFGQLGLWLDWENPNPSLYPTNAAYNKLPYAGYKDISGLIVILKGWTNQLKGIYTAPDFWNNRIVPHGDPNVQGTAEWFAKVCALWLARYIGGDPGTIGAWPAYTIWQYQQNPDYSSFNGTQDQFNAFFSVTPPAPVPAPTPASTSDYNQGFNDCLTMIVNYSLSQRK